MRLSDLHRHAVERPEALAVVEDGQEHSYQAFFGHVQHCLDYLRTLELDNSKPVAIFGGAFQSWIQITAFRHLGFDTICIKSQEILEDLCLRKPHYISAFDSFFDENLMRYCGTSGNMSVHVPVAQNLAPVIVAEENFEIGDRIGGHIAYTSGTTGVYKKVYYSQDVLEKEVFPVPVATNAVYHSLGYMPWTAAGAKYPPRVWEKGGTVLFDRRPDWANRFFEYPVSQTCLVSEYLRIICNSKARQPSQYPRFEVIMGGGFIQEKFAFDFMRKFNCNLHLCYGGTEFSTVLCRTVRTAEDLVWIDLIQDDYFEIVDDLGNQVSKNIEGRVRIKLYPWEPQGYYEDETSTRRFYSNGHFYPGDMAVQRDDGRIRILGRVNDVIVIDGLKVSVSPLEETARSELGCANVCLFSRQDDAGGEFILVVMECDTLPDMNSINYYSRYWQSRFNEIKFVQLHRFPRNENGMEKVNRKKVLDLALTQIS